jgi:sterol O-acyltransferase
MVMKMHSYMSVNGYLQHVSYQSQLLLAELRRVTIERQGSWDEAIILAKSRRAELDANAFTDTESAFGESTSVTPNDIRAYTQDDMLSGSRKSFTDAATANTLRKRLLAVSPEANPRFGTPSQQESETPLQPPPPIAGDKPHPIEIHPLVDHPDDQISTLANEYTELQAELISPGPHHVQWPNNITMRNFVVFQMIPTLVYELEYPRTDR